MSSDAKWMLLAFTFQIILLPVQMLIFLATRREKEQTLLIIKEGMKQALRVIMTRGPR